MALPNLGIWPHKYILMARRWALGEKLEIRMKMMQPEPKRQADSQMIEEQSGVRHRRQETDKSENYEKDWTRLNPGGGKVEQTQGQSW